MADVIQKLIEIVGDGSKFAAALDEIEQQQKAAQERLKQIDLQADQARATLQGNAQKRVLSLLDAERRSVEQHVAQITQLRKNVEDSITSAAQKGANDRLKIAEKEAQERSRFDMGAIRGFARNAASESGLNLPMLTGGAAGIAGALAGAGFSELVKKAIDETVAWANSIRDLAIVAQGSAREVSTLAAVADRYGVSTDKLELALRNLASAVELNPDQFAALGVSIEDANGKTRPLIDIFNDVRTVLAGASGDTSTMRVAQELFGRSVQDLIPMLRASQSEIDAYAQSAQNSGRVIDESAIAKAKEWELATAQLGSTISNAMHTIGGVAIPFVVNALRGLGQAFDTAATIARNAWAWITSGGSAGSINPFDAVDAAQARANANYADQVRLAQEAANSALGIGGGTDLKGDTQAALADANKAAGAASQAAIQNMQDEKRARDDEYQTAIDDVKKLQQAEQERHDAAVQQIQDQRDAALAAIQATMDAEKEADHQADLAAQRRQILGQDTVSVLQARIDALNEIAAIEDEEQRKADAAAHLADLQTAAEHEATVQIYRTKSETEDQYNQRVYDQQQRLKAANKAVGDQQVTIAKDASKKALKAQIDGIQQQIKAEQTPSAIEKLDLSESRKIRDDAHKAEVGQINAEAKAAKDAEDARTAASKKTTDLRIADLNAELKAYNDTVDAEIRAAERMASGINAATSTIKGVNIPVTFNGQGPDALARNNPAETVFGGKGPDALARDISDPIGQTVASFFATLPTNVAGAYEGAQDFLGKLLKNYLSTYGISETHAAGGSVQLRELTALVGLNSGKVSAVAGAGETADILPRGVGGNAGPSGPITIQLIADGRKLAEVVVPHIARGLKAHTGYGRKA